MKTKIILATIIMLIATGRAFTQTDTNLSWVYKQANLTERFLSKYDYFAVNKSESRNTIAPMTDTATFELKVNSQVMGDYKIKGKIIMHVTKSGNLNDYNYQHVKEEQILMVLNESGKEYFMVHLYFISDGSVKPAWFKYLYEEAPMMCESLINLVNK